MNYLIMKTGCFQLTYLENYSPLECLMRNLIMNTYNNYSFVAVNFFSKLYDESFYLVINLIK